MGQPSRKAVCFPVLRLWRLPSPHQNPGFLPQASPSALTRPHQLKAAFKESMPFLIAVITCKLLVALINYYKKLLKPWLYAELFFLFYPGNPGE